MNILTYEPFPNIFKAFINYPHSMILSHVMATKHEHMLMTDSRFLWWWSQSSMHSSDVLSFQRNLTSPLSWWSCTTCSPTLTTETAHSSEQPVNTHHTMHGHTPGNSNLQHTLHLLCLYFYANCHNRVQYTICVLLYGTQSYIINYHHQHTSWHVPFNSSPHGFLEPT
jgi:hypothetical protein